MESIPPVIQDVSVQTWIGAPYIKLQAADLESGIGRVELWADGQYVSEIYPEGRHGYDGLKAASDSFLYRIYSLSGGLFDYRITPNFNMAGKLIQIKAFDIHGNVSVAQVQ